MLSDEQIKEKFTILAAETEKYAGMYRNFDNEILNLVLCLGNLLKLIINRQQEQKLPSETEQQQYIQFAEALYQFNKEVTAFCVYNRLTGNQQDSKFYKKIPSLIEPYKKTLPFLKDLKILVESSEIFQKDKVNTIGINFNVLNECYRSLYKIIRPNLQERAIQVLDL